MFNKSRDLLLGFALNYNADYKAYIPMASIIEVKDNVLKHAIKQANKATLIGMNFEGLPKEYEELLLICTAFSNEVLIKKFKINNKKTFESILNDKMLQKQFNYYLNQKLNDFLVKIVAIKGPLAINFSREDWFQNNQINYSEYKIEPSNREEGKQSLL